MNNDQGFFACLIIAMNYEVHEKNKKCVFWLVMSIAFLIRGLI